MHKRLIQIFLIKGKFNQTQLQATCQNYGFTTFIKIILLQSLKTFSWIVSFREYVACFPKLWKLVCLSLNISCIRSKIFILNRSRTSISTLHSKSLGRIFMPMNELTYIKQEFENCRLYNATKLTRSDITSSKNNQHIVLRLKRSKTDVKHTDEEIFLTTIDEFWCTVFVFCKLFMLEHQLNSASLFNVADGMILVHKLMIEILCQKLQSVGIPHHPYSGHNFWKRRV